MALSNKTTADIKRIRDEMLSTTVEDLRGYADFVDALVAENQLPITRDTIFGMASVTKSFTALAIMQMQIL